MPKHFLRDKRRDNESEKRKLYMICHPGLLDSPLDTRIRVPDQEFTGHIPVGWSKGVSNSTMTEPDKGS